MHSSHEKKKEKEEKCNFKEDVHIDDMLYTAAKW